MPGSLVTGTPSGSEWWLCAGGQLALASDDRLTMRRVDIRQSPFPGPSANVIRCGQVEGGDHVLHCCRPLAIVGIVHTFAGLRRSRLDRFAERPYPFCPREQPRPVQMDDQENAFACQGLSKPAPPRRGVTRRRRNHAVSQCSCFLQIVVPQIDVHVVRARRAPTVPAR